MILTYSVSCTITHGIHHSFSSHLKSNFGRKEEYKNTLDIKIFTGKEYTAI